MITSATVCFTEAAAPEEAAHSFSKGDTKLADSNPGKADDFHQLISKEMVRKTPQIPDQKLKDPSEPLLPADRDASVGSESRILNCNDVVFGLLAEEPAEEIDNSAPSETPDNDLEAISLVIIESLVAIFAPQLYQEPAPLRQMVPATPETGSDAGGTEMNSFAQSFESMDLKQSPFTSASSKQAALSVLMGKEIPPMQEQAEKIASPNPVLPLTDVAPVSDGKDVPATDFVATSELTESLKTEAFDEVQPPPTFRPKSMPKKEAGSRLSDGGTGVALKSLDMNVTVEKNEIAGSEEKNLPLWHRTARFSIDIAKRGDARGDTAILPDKKDTAGQALFSSLTEHVKVHSVINVPEAEPVAAVNQVQQTERITNLITREVVMIKKLGADSLAVSLKVDNNTQIFLRLNHHEGQVHAFVSCERDTMPVLEKHWQQLQESLARQNVQLMPLNEKFSSVTPDSNSASNSNLSKQFEQPSQRDSQSRRELPEQPISTLKSASPTSKSTTKSRVIMPLGWETYA